MDTNEVAAASSGAPVEAGTEMVNVQGQESGAAGGSDALQGTCGNVRNGKIEDNASGPATASFDPTREEANKLCVPAAVSGDKCRTSEACGIDEVPVYLSGGSEVGEQVFFTFLFPFTNTNTIILPV